MQEFELLKKHICIHAYIIEDIGILICYLISDCGSPRFKHNSNANAKLHMHCSFLLHPNHMQSYEKKLQLYNLGYMQTAKTVSKAQRGGSAFHNHSNFV